LTLTWDFEGCNISGILIIGDFIPDFMTPNRDNLNVSPGCLDVVGVGGGGGRKVQEMNDVNDVIQCKSERINRDLGLAGVLEVGSPDARGIYP
jgi:hypothetical protein